MIDKLSEVQIGKLKIEVIFISEELSKEEIKDLEILLRRNHHVFAWIIDQMPRINPEVACHQLEVNPKIKQV